jgi:transcription elongation factor Elf1
MASGMDWIDTIVESVRSLECPCCGARLTSSGVRGVTTERDALIMRLACRVCGESSVAIVKRELMAAITRDDVLDVHEFLQRWDGPLAALLSPERKPV